MSRILSTLLALTALLLAVDAIPQTRAPERAVAVTFDDLPATPAGVVVNDVASLHELTRKLLSAVRMHSVPAVGFVNEGKLFVEGGGPRDVDGRIGLLRLSVGPPTAPRLRRPRPEHPIRRGQTKPWRARAIQD